MFICTNYDTKYSHLGNISPDHNIFCAHTYAHLSERLYVQVIAKCMTRKMTTGSARDIKQIELRFCMYVYC